MAKFEPAISQTLKHEGGLENDKFDTGGITAFGISLVFYKKNVKVDATAEDIRHLTADEATSIYKKFFWDRNRYEEIENQKLANRVFDLSVNIGPTMANSLLQKAVNFLKPSLHLVVDGSLGVKTLAAINELSADALYQALINKAESYYEAIASHGENHRFLFGWLSRLKN